MIDAGFDVRLTPMAKRDFLNQLAWLAEHRSTEFAANFDRELHQLLSSISRHPYRWQEWVVSGRKLRRAVLNRK